MATAPEQKEEPAGAPPAAPTSVVGRSRAELADEDVDDELDVEPPEESLAEIFGDKRKVSQSFEELGSQGEVDRTREDSASSDDDGSDRDAGGESDERNSGEEDGKDTEGSVQSSAEPDEEVGEEEYDEELGEEAPTRRADSDRPDDVDDPAMILPLSRQSMAIADELPPEEREMMQDFKRRMQDHRKEVGVRHQKIMSERRRAERIRNYWIKKRGTEDFLNPENVKQEFIDIAQFKPLASDAQMPEEYRKAKELRSLTFAQKVSELERWWAETRRRRRHRG